MAPEKDMEMKEIDLSQRVPIRPEHPNSWVFFDGKLARYHEVHIGVMTHALHYGTACFEGIRAYWNGEREQLFLLQAEAHFDRLHNSARILMMELPYSTSELIEVTLELLRRNRYRTDVYIRPLVYKSAEQIGVLLHGVADSCLIYTEPMGNYVDIEHGLRCGVSSWRRPPDDAMPARAKATACYLNSALAKSEALQNGFDEAIELTIDGHVSEGSAENIFIFKDGAFITPQVSDDILEGITRRLVMQLICDELHMPVIERSIDRTELYTASEVFLCGTGAQVSPVVEIDHRKIGDGRIGEFSQKLQQIYFSAVRGDSEKYSRWSAPVY